MLAVSDEGPGIKAGDRKRIFDPFYRVPTGNLHDVKGFGLGLSMVKKLVELHGGNIKLKSGKGKGSKFLLSIPMDSDE